MLLLPLLALCFCGAASRTAPLAKRKTRGEQPFLPSVIAMTRFNCAFPLCPTTALDVCTLDEHYELGRPHVIATLIPQTPTEEMDFSQTTFSAWDNSTRSHYTLASRVVGGEPFTQLFTVYIAPNGTSGGLVSSVEVQLPGGVAPADIRYVFTHGGTVYLATAAAELYPIAPATGALGNATALLPPNSELVDTRAATFDAQSGTFYVNALGASGSHYLHSYNVATGVAGAPVGPLPATPNTDAGGGGVRVDDAVATLPVYRPAADGGGFRLLEMRVSPLFPWIFMAFLDPSTGNSTEIPLPDQWYQDYDIDPEIFPTQWAGSTRRVWDYDPVQQCAWFKLYDECGGNDDCDEDETVVCALLLHNPPGRQIAMVLKRGSPIPACTYHPLTLPATPTPHPPHNYKHAQTYNGITAMLIGT
jgi:hypothetical protein